MQGAPFLEILFLAMLAGFIAFRLYSVLGRRTGEERSPEDRARLSERPVPAQVATADKVVGFPGMAKPSEMDTTAAARPGLTDIKLADRKFETAAFLTGARSAYEMIVTAFAKGDRDTLHPLLSSDVFAAFDGVIKNREVKRERMEFDFVALKGARITGAVLKEHRAEITVTFDSEILLAGYDADGKLIEGDGKEPHLVTDVWTFARDITASDPNWTLVATSNAR